MLNADPFPDIPTLHATEIRSVWSLPGESPLDAAVRVLGEDESTRKGKGS